MRRTPAELPMCYVPQNILLESQDQQSPGSLLLGYDIVPEPLPQMEPRLGTNPPTPHVDIWAPMHNRPVCRVTGIVGRPPYRLTQT